MEKRVLMVATVPSMIGQFNIDNIKILIDMGYQVDVAGDFTDTSVWPKERVQKFKDQMDEMGVECIQLDFSRSPLKLNRHLNSYNEVVKLIEDRRYSFIHTHTPIASAIVRQAAHKTGTAVIYTAHGFHFYDGAPLKNWLIFYPIEKHFSRYTDVLITINKEDYKRASEKFHAKKTVYIPGVGVDTEKFAVCKVDRSAKRAELGVKDDDFLLLSVGELSDRKNQKVVIDALIKMKAEGCLDNIVYLVVGKGDKEDEFNVRIQQHDLFDHIKLLGFRSDIDELCETVDCFVHPSVREGLGIAPLEAMAAGLPLISANVNGIKDYTEDGVSGCCVDPNNIEEMVIAIKRMHDDKEFRDKCSVNNFSKAKTFDIQNTKEIMLKVYGGGYKHLLSVVVRQKKREELGVPRNAKVLLSIGELSLRKNHKVIVEALQKLPDDYWYVIVGIGDLQNKLNSLDRTGRLRILGYRYDIVEILRASDCFVFPSLQEGLPVALMEAMAAGLPCIASRIRGNEDLLREGLVYTNNPKEWVREIEKFKNKYYMNSEGISAFDKKNIQKAMNTIYLRGSDYEI